MSYFLCLDCSYHHEHRCPVRYKPTLDTNVEIDGVILSCEILNGIYDAMLEIKEKRQKIKEDIPK